MKSKGFDYWGPPKPTSTPELMFPYGIDNAAWARANGFGRELLDRVTADQHYVSNLSSSARNRYYLDLDGAGPRGPGVTVKLPTGEVIGHSTAGCIAVADRELFGHYRYWFRIDSQYQDLTILLANQVILDHSYAMTVRKWSTCMSRHDDHYISPAQAMESFLAATPPRSLARERVVAETEVRCGHQVGLFRVARTIAGLDAKRIDRQFSAVITADKQFDTSALRRADEILGLS